MALARMPEVDPGIAALALWCTHRDDAGPTRTQGDMILYGPGFDLAPLPEQIGLAAHHVLHVALRHSARAAEMALRQGAAFDARLYNLAGDAIVNEVLLAGGHALPRPAVRASELLSALPDSEGGDVLATWDTDRLYLALTAETGGRAPARDAAEEYAQARRFTEDLGAEAGEDAQPDQWAARLEQAMEAGRGAGLGIGPALHSFADLPAARVPWERVLRRLLARAVSEVPRRTHKRPARGWIARAALAQAGGGAEPAFEPGFARDQLRPRIVLAVDTSSSITDAQMSAFAAEAMSIGRRSGAEVHLLGFDTEVHTETVLRDPEALTQIAFRRGGGTGFAPVIEAAMTRVPSIIVVMTDLDGPLGPAPKAPVVWAVPHVVPEPLPFGRVLVMDR